MIESVQRFTNKLFGVRNDMPKVDALVAKRDASIREEFADEIERLRAENERLRDLLRRLVRWVDTCPVVSTEDGAAYEEDCSEFRQVIGAWADRPSDKEERE